ENRSEAERRLEQELTLIEHHRLSGFFLVYHDLFDLAREVAADVRRGSRRATGNLLPGRGRGSSVSSIVCYLLGLSHIDPVANRLFLGRFLNETLASVPDIDLDFPREIRVELVPLERAAMPDRVVCQWDKDSCDDARFVKIDFLALGMLSLVEECVELVARREGEPPDLSRIDFADQAVYDRICRGDTVGLFQIESRAQIQMLRRTRPRDLADLAVEVAIVRPGPIVGGAVNPYVRRR